MTRKACLIFLYLLMQVARISGQEIPAATEQQLESLAEVADTENEDDSWLQELESLREHPLNLNHAAAEELRQLRVTDLQISNLLIYRRLLGDLLHIYELQAVPTWDLVTIKKILSFVTVSESISFKEIMNRRLKKGGHRFLLRVSQVLERSVGFNNSKTNQYVGSPQRIFFKYKYVYKDQLQFGLLGDKDAGEPMFKASQKTGFDFYSLYLFIRNKGIIRHIALGDFTVNIGQGLIHWQSLAFSKSAEVTSVKRQSAVLRPYNSAGEFNFHRGAGISLQKGKIVTTVFISYRQLSANTELDSIRNSKIASSILTGGYHRTEGEMADKNALRQFTSGAVFSWQTEDFKLALNGVYYRFSVPLQKRNEVYNLYSIRGDNWANVSIDYSYSYKNLHLFGETAVDKKFNPAFLNGLLLCVNRSVDLSLLHRHIASSYQSVYGKAFTENTLPTNEIGLFAGITIRPAAGWRIDGYADLFKFPWLRFNADAPGAGSELFVQLTYTPNKLAELYTRFRYSGKESNMPGTDGPVNYLTLITKKNWRTHFQYKLSPNFTMRARVEITLVDIKPSYTEEGFLIFADLLYKPMLRPFSGGIRLQYFETGGYDSRVYAFENDVLYGSSIPAFDGKGWRYYFNLSYDFGKKLRFWLRWSRTKNLEKTGFGSGLDEIPQTHKSELKFQVQYLL